MSLHKKLFIFILFVQLLIISYLIYTIFVRYISPKIFSTFIDKKTIHFSPTDTLHYYFEPKPNIVITEQYYKQVSLTSIPKYTINKDTLNERFNYPIQKGENTYRIITLGDSFTYGQYMNTADNWPEVLEDTLKKCKSKTTFEVINLAVPSYDIQYSIERYKKRGMKYNPNLIIWFLKNDDFLQINEITLPMKMRNLEEMKKNGELKKSIENGEYWPHTKKAIEDFEHTYTLEEILSKQREILNTMNDYYSGDLLIFSPKYTPKNQKIIMEDFAKKRKNTYLYLDLPQFSLLPDQHPSKEGHTQIAINIYKYLMNEKLFSCTN